MDSFMLGKKFFILLFVTILWGLSDSFAASGLPKYYPQDFVDHYYSSQFEDDDVKQALHLIISQYHVKTNGRDVIQEECIEKQDCYIHVGNFSYESARKILFGHLHLQETKFGPMVEDVYCEKEYYAADGVGKNQIPNPNLLNCEHTWPQSKFTSKFPKNMQKVDLHHLYPSESVSNSTRGNSIFSEVDGVAVSQSCWTSRKGKSQKSGERAFEPPLKHRGNVARAMFYFSTRYNIAIDPVQEFYFRKWHEEDPVDEQEIQRNEEIFKYQKNRNPYIDLPDLVDKIGDF